MSQFGGVQKDAKVQIKRSNGVVHEAIVTSVEQDTSVVHVEWFENQDVKGKELSLSAIFDLNPDLRPRGQPSVKIQSKSESRFDNRKSIIVGPANKQRLKKENQKPTVSVPTFDIDCSSRPSEKQSSSSFVPPPSRIAKARKSEVVRNVERIEGERKVRRENQTRMRYQRDQVKRKHDVNDKQWEFSEMIENWRDENPPFSGNPHRRSDQEINVCVRKRPLNTKEVRNKETDVVSKHGEVCYIHEPKSKVDLTKYLEHQKFRFDYIFDLDDDNTTVYEYTAKPLVESMFDRGMATCFAYGQTGSGKTHTMGGEFSGKNQNCRSGIYALAAADVFKRLSHAEYEDFRLEVSFFEIYSNKVFDLLNKKQRLRVLEDKEGNIRVVNLTTEEVETVSDVIKILKEGSLCRTSGQTSANSNSSRSHAVFQLRLTNNKKTHGMFSLIDLAGNERGADTMSADRVTRQEGADINKSLLALKECIRAMGRDAAHIPFRGSTLTKVLRDSFVGKKSRTCMIATISPGFSSCENTINTLRYADRVKGLNAADENQIKQKSDAEQLNTVQEESLECDLNDTEEQTAIDMLASNNSDEFSPELLAITKAQATADASEERVLQKTDDLIPWVVQQMEELQGARDAADNPESDPRVFAEKLAEILNAISDEALHVKAAAEQFTDKLGEVDKLVTQQQAQERQQRGSRVQISAQQRRRK